MTEARITAETMMRERRDTWLKSIFSKGDLMMIDKWIFGNDPHLDRSEAILCLLKTPKDRERLEIFASPPYPCRHDHNSFRPRFPALESATGMRTPRLKWRA